VNQASSTGIEPRVAALLCYSVWWVTGLVFLWVERRDAAVRFHAAQSIVLFGALSVVLIGLGVASALTLILSSGSYTAVRAAANVVWAGGAVVWLILVLKAWRGETWRVPLVATLADGLVSKTS
jgi:uncharacterized membrane protein